MSPPVASPSTASAVGVTSKSVAPSTRAPAAACGPCSTNTPWPRCHRAGSTAPRGRPAPLSKPWSDTTITCARSPASSNSRPSIRSWNS